MFTVVTQKNLGDAKRYFQEHLTRNDYYTAEEIRPGQWIGLGAQRLGLDTTRAVSCEEFERLCENQHPQTGERLTLRQNEKDHRRVFYDFTCSAPKSVSVLAVTLNDQRLVIAHEAAVEAAFRELEGFAATRVRKQGQQLDRKTGNLVAARFTHTTSRALDPQLHTHCTVFNATFDETENVWKALQAGPMYEAIRYGSEVYRNELARRLQAFGYRTVPARHGFEIEGVSESILRRFSKRAQQRNAVVREMEQKLGRKLSNNEVAYAVRRSRARKLKTISTAEIRDRQLTELSREELATLRSVRHTAKENHGERSSHNEPDAIEYAAAHIFERKSVVPEHELLETALAWRRGQTDLERLKAAMRRSTALVATDNGYSTREILATELALIAAVTRGKDAVQPLNFRHSPTDWLSDDQQAALRQVLQSSDRITGIRRLAGTGKTTALEELKTACEKSGYCVRFCAPTASATEVLRQEGFDAVTLAALLQIEPNAAERTVVVLDEAGAVGIDDMRRLFDRTQNDRLILCGDTGQHGSVARGDALRLLEDHSDFQFGQLTRIHRQQRADYRRAVELASKGPTTAALAQLERMSAITELLPADLHAAAARDYLSIVEKRKTELQVAPSWAEIETLTENVRNALKACGQLQCDEREFRVFDSMSWTQAQKRDPGQYRPGLVLRFHQPARGFARHESVEVEMATEGGLQLRRGDGSISSFKLDGGRACFEVGEWRTLKIAPGDKLLLQANRSRQFVNGELVEVKAVAGQSILLSDGRTLPPDYRTFTHGYAVTSHAAQGKTVDHVLLVASCRSFSAVNREQFYVSISRGRQV